MRLEEYEIKVGFHHARLEDYVMKIESYYKGLKEYEIKVKTRRSEFELNLMFFLKCTQSITQYRLQVIEHQTIKI